MTNPNPSRRRYAKRHTPATTTNTRGKSKCGCAVVSYEVAQLRQRVAYL